MTGDPFAAVSVSIGRILGVFAGVGIGVGITHLDAAPTLKVAIALLLATVAGIVLKVGQRPNLEVPIAALFLIGFAGANVSALGIQRIWETGVGAVEERIGHGARVFRHARTLARDVADMPPRDPVLAMATRHLADAVDRSLRGVDASEPLERAAAELAQPTAGGEAVIVASQLRQLLADLRPV